MIGRLGAALVVAATAGTSAASAQDLPAQPSEMSPAEIEALYKARQDSARMRFTEADVAFVTGMISHHAQALIMSDMAPTHGANPTMLTLTARIINAQKDEIALMQKWLRDRGQPVPEVHIDGLNLMIHTPTPDDAAHDDHMAVSAHGAHSMPGMLTQAQLEKLDASFGEDFDQQFLIYMIQHHKGAVTMVYDLFAVDGTGQDEAIYKLASDIQADQLTEIGRMQRMLLGELEPDGSR